MAFIHKDLLHPDINLGIYRAEVSLFKATTESVQSLKLGYSKKARVDKTREVLHNLTAAARREQVRKALGGGCLDTFQVQRIHDKLTILANNCDLSNRMDIHADGSGKEAWLATHPGCVGREPWEYLKYLPCGPLQLGVNADQVVCDIKVPIYSEQEQCDIDVNISACEEVCDVALGLTATDMDCNIALKLLKTQCNTCDIDADVIIACSEKCGLGDALLDLAQCKI